MTFEVKFLMTTDDETCEIASSPTLVTVSSETFSPASLKLVASAYVREDKQDRKIASTPISLAPAEREFLILAVDVRVHKTCSACMARDSCFLFYHMNFGRMVFDVYGRTINYKFGWRKCFDCMTPEERQEVKMQFYGD